MDRICLECEYPFTVGRRPNAKTCGPVCMRKRRLNKAKAWKKEHPDYMPAYLKNYWSGKSRKKYKLARRLEALLLGKK